MTDPHEIEACRRLWATVVFINTKDAIRAQIRRLQGHHITGTDATIEWIMSRHFLDRCALAGIDDATELRRRMVEQMQTVEGCALLLRRLTEVEEVRRSRTRNKSPWGWI